MWFLVITFLVLSVCWHYTQLLSPHRLEHSASYAYRISYMILFVNLHWKMSVNGYKTDRIQSSYRVSNCGHTKYETLMWGNILDDGRHLKCILVQKKQTNWGQKLVPVGKKQTIKSFCLTKKKTTCILNTFVNLLYMLNRTRLWVKIFNLINT